MSSISMYALYFPGVHGCSQICRVWHLKQIEKETHTQQNIRTIKHERQSIKHKAFQHKTQNTWTEQKTKKTQTTTKTDGLLHNTNDTARITR